MNKSLVVYKASAGSGKTFTLTIEYIKLLILNPQAFHSILAVTFTNKATEEMKLRILSQLYGIWKNLDDSQSYIQTICIDLNVSADFVSKRAGVAITLLLHNYNKFHVETIDSFFQSILRNLSRELDLTTNLRIELNDTQIEEKAVDELIDSLGINDSILGWILSYIKDNISEDKGWNVIRSIKSFGKTIFKDFYKEASGKLNCAMSNGTFFDNYKSQIYNKKKNALARMQKYSNTFFEILKNNNLSVNDFSNKEKGVCGFFIKLQNGIFDEKTIGKRTKECIENAEKWSSKNSNKRNVIISLANNCLIDLLKSAVNDRQTQWREYKSAELTLRHLNQLRLLYCIEKKVHELNDNDNRFLLSDTQYFLKSLIGDSDSPFIFEKIGAYIKYIMIDEFQDTSSIQWQNFKVLLADCMSQSDSRNIVVGDVKQSIYRWRDSDWRLLNDIEKQIPKSNQIMEIKTLETNYRSLRNIVEFNNSFFVEAAKNEYDKNKALNENAAQELVNAYSDVKQKIPNWKKQEGYVGIELLPHTDYELCTLQIVAEKVKMLSSNGIRQNEICILVRTNACIPLIANYFMNNLPEVRIVSDEAFRLGTSTAVNIIVHALHLLTHRDDAISKAYLVKSYQKIILGKNTSEYEMLSDIDIDNLLPQNYIEFTDSLCRTPLYELAELIFNIFDLKKLKGQSSYVCAFFDILSDFTEEVSSDIDTFVEKWNETLCNTTIQSNDIDGIRLISIHKSKGLEFDNVIIPFCDWQIEKNNGNIIWCQPETSPYNELPLVPVDYSSGLMGTIYEKDYLKERIHNCVDNLNLLYVAFTRAVKNLFVIGKRDATNSRSVLIQSCLPNIVSSLKESIYVNTENKLESIRFEYGILAGRESIKEVETDNIFLTTPLVEKFEMENFINSAEFKQSNKSQEFISNKENIDESNHYIKLGLVLHRVFSTIETDRDIERALLQLQTEGVLPCNEVDSKKIIKILRDRLSDPIVQEWFSGKWKVFNECSIIYTDSQNKIVKRRPDRVMTDGKRMIVVDFKFGTPKKEYHEQVKQYIELLHTMGYKKVEGYLWYVYNNIIERI